MIAFLLAIILGCALVVTMGVSKSRDKAMEEAINPQRTSTILGKSKVDTWIEEVCDIGLENRVERLRKVEPDIGGKDFILAQYAKVPYEYATKGLTQNGGGDTVSEIYGKKGFFDYARWYDEELHKHGFKYRLAFAGLDRPPEGTSDTMRDYWEHYLQPPLNRMLLYQVPEDAWKYAHDDGKAYVFQSPWEPSFMNAPSAKQYLIDSRNPYKTNFDNNPKLKEQSDACIKWFGEVCDWNLEADIFGRMTSVDIYDRATWTPTDEFLKRMNDELGLSEYDLSAMCEIYAPHQLCDRGSYAKTRFAPIDTLVYLADRGKIPSYLAVNGIKRIGRNVHDAPQLLRKFMRWYDWLLRKNGFKYQLLYRETKAANIGKDEPGDEWSQVPDGIGTPLAAISDDENIKPGLYLWKPMEKWIESNNGIGGMLIFDLGTAIEKTIYN